VFLYKAHLTVPQPSLTFNNSSKGITTGDCNDTSGYCDLYAWCPLEDDLPPQQASILTLVSNFTVYLKSYARWEHFDEERSNVNGQLVPGYNYFTVGEMIAQ
jgi:hypothetical protein